MPRKKKKTEKQPLLFLERPAGEARVHHNVPEVRAAINPKDFFTDTQRGHKGSTLKSWICPQFHTSAPAAALPVQRGRRKCISSTSILGNLSQLSRKSSVSKFPTLLFESKPRQHHLKHIQRRNVSDITVSLASGHQQGISQSNSTICNVQTVKEDQNNHRAGIVSCSKNKSKRSSVEDPSSPAFKDCTNSGTGQQIPDVVTPKVTQEYSTYSHALNLLRSPPCNPSCSRILDILVPDTPERDYGVKVTWRRRRGLMLLLKEKGHLSDIDTVIQI